MNIIFVPPTFCVWSRLTSYRHGEEVTQEKDDNTITKESVNEPLDLTALSSRQQDERPRAVFACTPVLTLRSCPPYNYCPFRKPAVIEDVWEGTPAILSDQEECNFLGFRITPGAKQEESRTEDMCTSHKKKCCWPFSFFHCKEDPDSLMTSPCTSHPKFSHKRKKKKKKAKTLFEYKKKKKRKKMKSKSKSRSLDHWFDPPLTSSDIQVLPEDLSLTSKSSALEEPDYLSEPVLGAISAMNLNDHSESSNNSLVARNNYDIEEPDKSSPEHKPLENNRVMWNSFCRRSSPTLTSSDHKPLKNYREIQGSFNISEACNLLSSKQNSLENSREKHDKINSVDLCSVSQSEHKILENNKDIQDTFQDKNSSGVDSYKDIPPGQTLSLSRNLRQNCESVCNNKRGSNGWEESLRPRPPAADHYQSYISLRKRKSSSSTDSSSLTKIIPKYSRSSSFRENGMKKKATRKKIFQKNSWRRKDVKTSEKKKEDFESTENPHKILEPSIGDIVWGKLGSTPWWPAIVIWGSDCGQPPAHPDQTWVFWFGDHKISELPKDKLLGLVGAFNDNYIDLGGKFFKRGVLEALQEMAVRAGVDVAEGDSAKLLSWAKHGFRTESRKTNPWAPSVENPIPENVRRRLDRIKAQYLEALLLLESQTSLQPRFSRFAQLENSGSALKKVRERKLSIQDVCVACDSSSEDIVTQHPLIEGGLCQQCKDDIIETMFAYGDDGTNAYCVICGQAGELIICDNTDCNKCYCTGCIDVLISPGTHKKVLAADPWFCFICTEYDPERNGLIQPKLDWQQNVLKLFQPEKSIQLSPSSDDYREKKPIRVLSLFDGIGTGRYVLDQLGIEVEAYYASEMDHDAINISIVQHKCNVTHLGQIEEISDAEVAKLCPVDLVIGGSPCVDPSLVSSGRKGLYDATGTGRLFFDFFRLLKAVQLANKERHVFWLYENVTSIPQEYKSIITRFLQCEPALIDSKYFAPQNQARYFWGNIPGMYAPLQPHFHMLRQAVKLNSSLSSNLNQEVETVSSDTMCNNLPSESKDSLTHGNTSDDKDALRVTDIEQVFGFPKHYTDTGNIPLGRRQQLLAKAWSVPIMKHIFMPLRNFFKTFSLPFVPQPSPASTIDILPDSS
ncbi:DNA (cytosine-5)-methyltransferase 3B-like isoform X5 [Tachypleus tridentatus]|uniref:DNA (cytosine-5)-methyltransferase 3B-like isoform X5 n=1 Tax=Tachypleus tridentatus TaxID=6853 RepID=UPI003FCF1973